MPVSTQKRARLAQALDPMPTWSSLPYGLVHNMGDCLLASNDIDAYMAFRAVCHDWRSITKDDPAKAKVGEDIDPVTVFEPTKWAMLDHHDDLVTLVNVDTGRFLFKRIPLLRRFFIVNATSGGLILLGESSEPHRACILNPFTGSIALFKVRIPNEGVAAVAMTTKPSLTVFISTKTAKIMWADQSMETFRHFWIAYPNMLSCMTSYDSKIYTIDRYGSIYLSTFVVTTGEPRQRCAMDISMKVISPSLDTDLDTSGQGLMSGRYYLVESAGDLLLVTKPFHFTVDQPVVRRVNMETQMIEPVSSIGSRALFVGDGRCLSIDADKFPSIQGGCVYFLKPIIDQGYYPAEDRTIIIVHVVDNFIELHWGWATIQGCFRPFTLTKVFEDYCRSDHYSKLCEMMASKSDLSDVDDSSSSDESSSSELNDEDSSSSELDDEERSSSEIADD